MEARLERLEAVQSMVLEISQISASSSDVTGFLQAVHQALGRLMYAANFYVALYDKQQHAIRYAYRVDEIDAPVDPAAWFVLASPDQSPTAWIILNRKSLLMTAEEDAARENAVIAAGGEAWGTGARAEHWMGCPLLDQQKQPLGAMVIQSYDASHTYSEEDQALFALIANHISTSLQAVQSLDRLEQAVADRTALLEHEVQERRRAETLQRVLYEIAELSITVTETELKFSRLHDIVSQLLQVPNFMVALYLPDSDEFSIQYMRDEKDADLKGQRFPMGAGMTSYVVHQRHAQLIDQQRLQKLVSDGEIQVLGSSDLVSWMGAPMLADEYIHGVIIVQSYKADIIYTEADLDLLAFVANHVASALARIKADSDIREAYTRLAQQNDTLNHTLAALQAAQAELISQEKLASLGRLVAGVAHEINTPVGICVTATSHMVEELALIRKDFEAGHLSKDSLQQFFDIMDQSLRIMTSNCQRSATLIRSFKQVAVDQSSESMREFDLRAYLEEILLSLHPKIKNKNISVKLECDKGVLVRNYPGALSQIITNMLMNSIHHGFDGREQGTVTIRAQRSQDQVELEFADDGIGMDDAALKKLFEPFFTTKRGQGGSGLGAHIVYNLVTGALHGTVRATSVLGEGLRYQLRFPQRRSLPVMEGS